MPEHKDGCVKYGIQPTTGLRSHRVRRLRRRYEVCLFLPLAFPGLRGTVPLDDASNTVEGEEASYQGLTVLFVCGEEADGSVP